MHSAARNSSPPGISLQHTALSNLGSQQQQRTTPPLSFAPSLSNPASPVVFAQSPPLNTPISNQLSPVSSPSSNSPRSSTSSQNSLARVQNQFSLPTSSRTSPLSLNTFPSFSSSTSLPTLESSSSIQSTVSPTIQTPSALSPSAPQFQTKPKLLDMPIDIHSLKLALSPIIVEEPAPRIRSASAGMAGSEILSLTTALLNEGPTPTQESFKTLQPSSLPMHSTRSSVPFVPVNTVSSFGPPNPTTHIIEIDDSPIPPSEASPDVSSLATSPSLISGLTHPSLSQYQTYGPSDAQSAAVTISSPESQVQPAAVEDDFRTPNVYINGLPPNFPEDQLLAMTRDFGEVVSVRTFTRHVSDKPSGYGFVLFEDVDAAEKCIETLRKYRNLHPSYSKRIHKIPGTTYATALAAAAAASDASSPDTATDDASLQASDGDSFKSRMERLHDTASTNLYMEGLPMDINEPTLAALVSPYKIMSSRFFQTRLSVPARVIAFVRLETRTAAEEVVERLHGRMVRGWADAGCRISVRFADTSEQRELRRMERMNRDGDQSPSRLTVAQAALLNLKGGQLQTSPGLSPNFGGVNLPNVSPPFVLSSLPLVPGHSPSFAPIGARGIGQPGIVSPGVGLSSGLTYDPSLGHGSVSLGRCGDSFNQQLPHIVNRNMTPSPLPLQHHLDQQQRSHQYFPNPSLLHVGHDASSSLLSAYTPYEQALNARAAEFNATGSRIPSHHAGFSDATTLSGGTIRTTRGGMPDGIEVATRARDGYTQLEREILQQYMQKQQQQHQQQIPRQDHVVSGRGLGSGPALRAGGGMSGTAVLGRKLVNTLPSLSEEDFHAYAGDTHATDTIHASDRGVSVHLAPPVSQTRPPPIPPSRLALDDVNAKLNFTRQRNQTHTSGSKISARASNRRDNQGDGNEGVEERTRSTTMPDEYLGRRSFGGVGGFLGSSTTMTTAEGRSVIKNDNINSNNTTSGPQASNNIYNSSVPNSLIRNGNQHSSISSNPNSKNDNTINSNSGTQSAIIRDTYSNHPAVGSNSNNTCNMNTISTSKHTSTRIDTSTTTLRSAASNASSNNGPTTSDAASSAQVISISAHTRDSSGSDGNISPLDSPALTYSNSTRTPATLSPSTPFSAFAEGPPFDGGVVVAAGASAASESMHVGEECVKGEVGLGVGLSGTGKEGGKEKGSGVANVALGGQARVQVGVMGRPTA